MKEKDPGSKKVTNVYKGKAGVTHGEVYYDGYNTKQKAKPLDGSFDGSAAPRVGGGSVQGSGGVPAGGTKKMLKASKKRVSQSSASPQAKRSARKLY